MLLTLEHFFFLLHPHLLLFDFLDLEPSFDFELDLVELPFNNLCTCENNVAKKRIRDSSANGELGQI